jgi:hypothetical protein
MHVLIPRRDERRHRRDGAGAAGRPAIDAAFRDAAGLL